MIVFCYKIWIQNLFLLLPVIGTLFIKKAKNTNSNLTFLFSFAHLGNQTRFSWLILCNCSNWNDQRQDQFTVCKMCRLPYFHLLLFMLAINVSPNTIWKCILGQLDHLHSLQKDPGIFCGGSTWKNWKKWNVRSHRQFQKTMILFIF